MRMITLVLLRFSTEEQIGGLSFEYQERECRACEARNLHEDGLKREIVVVKDEAISGTVVLERPGVRRVLEMARLKQLKRVIVWKYDRLGRNEAESFTVIQRLEALGVEVLSATESSDKLVRGVQICVAAAEARKTSMRTREALRQLALNGYPTGGPVPFGLTGERFPDPTGKVDKDRKPMLRTRYRRHPENAVIVQKLFKLAADGWGDKKIAADFNRLGLESPSKRGRGWDCATVRNIRMNEVYRGTLVHGKHEFVRRPNGKRSPQKSTGPCPILVENCINIESIVERDSWLLAQRDSGRLHGPGGRGPNTKYALSGVATCGECGAGLVTQPSSKKGRTVLRMRCGYHARRGPNICGNSRTFHYDRVLGAILETLHADLFDAVNIRSLVESVGREIAARSAGASLDRERTEKELAKVEADLERVVDAIQQTQGAISALSVRALQLQELVTQLKIRLSDFSLPRIPKITNLESRVRSCLDRVEEIVRKGSPSEVQAELRRHLSTVAIYSDGRLRIEGTLGGLLQGETAVVHDSNSGGGI